MTKFAVFLRAVNVGGHSIIKMEELKKMFEAMNFKNVKTFIQSGNLIFDSGSKSEDTVRKKIEQSLTGKLDYDIYALVRTPAEISDMINSNPFRNAELNKELVLYLTLLTETPGKEKISAFEALSTPAESYRIINRELYSLIDKRPAKSLFSNNLVEKKLNVKATSRNWNTILKMHALINAAT